MKISVKIHSIYLLCFIFSTFQLSAFSTEKITFKSGDITLAGNLYLPKGDGPFPAIVFVHGSGKETRKNSQYSAKWLASIGYAALTYDKRGVGESEGDKNAWNRFSFHDLASDVVAAVEFLSKKKKINLKKIGLHAVSQGGWVAPLAASKSPLISFLIIKSTSVCTVQDDRVFERSARLKKEGFTETDIAEAKELQLLEPVKAGKDKFVEKFLEYKSKPWFKRVYLGDDPNSKTLKAWRDWYTTVVNFDPVHLFNESKIPVFWIFGDPELDKLGPVKNSIKAVEKMKNQGQPYEMVSYSGEGHNISERKYELALYNWLKKTNKYDTYKFRKH